VFNIDRPLSVASHPTLHTLFRETSQSIRDPRTGRSLHDVWRDLQNEFHNIPGVDGWGELFDPSRELRQPYIFEVPYDDATPFFNILALPASDMYYGADYGMYHSIYENFHWMNTVVDPTFEYHKVMALLQGFVALRLANADLAPLDYAEEASIWRKALQRNPKTAGSKELLRLVDQWEKDAVDLADAVSKMLNKKSRFSPELNRSIYRIARDFYRPGKDGVNNIYPGVSDADTSVLAAALKQRIRSLQAAKKALSRAK
jgi:N-acetylated-alpha-linked acidic dipeptidase